MPLGSKREWPNVRFDENMTEHDTCWQPDRRESLIDVGLRVNKFFSWFVREHRETSVACVVTHGVWMECALMMYCPEALDMGKKRPKNCDIYKLHISSSWINSESNENPTHALLLSEWTCTGIKITNTPLDDI